MSEKESVVNKKVKTFLYGTHQVTLETGQIAKQATGSVWVKMGETVLLVTVVACKKVSEGCDFFPLTVHYQERNYAVGKIPGGYFKREGRPSEKEILTSRLIDRALRPLFPEGFFNEVQVVATVLALDQEVPADIPAILGACAALRLSGLPFSGTLGGARVGYLKGDYILNPSWAVLKDSQLDLVVAGTKESVLMVESEAEELSEEVMLKAVLFGHEKMQIAISAIDELVAESTVTPWKFNSGDDKEFIAQWVKEQVELDLHETYKIKEKMERQDCLTGLYQKCVDNMPVAQWTRTVHEKELHTVFYDLWHAIVREKVLKGAPRLDGRDHTTVRPITVEVGVLPRVHGSALFTRGETQALVTTTLGTERDAQLIDALGGESREDFMLHYNFPPFCVGEIGPMSAPKRREVGHGKLAKRAIAPVVPKIDSFPYVIRVVSEILESNGSSSMASVCGTSLALMDAGVPVKAAVAGIAMGLIMQDSQYVVLTDILGDEDHLGDMDFKVAGTAHGVTALQMDIKISGITARIMQTALEQAKVGRLHILDIMGQALSQPRPEVSGHAPRMIMMKIDPQKIRDVIGKGGVMIREITEATQCTIDISDDGTIKIAAQTSEQGEAAKQRIEGLTAQAEVGKTYPGIVVKLLEFGAVVSFLSGYQGLVHISQIANVHVENVSDYLKENQAVHVKVIEIDRQGRIRLSIKQADF